MLPYFTEHFGNPSSMGHCYGWAASAAVEQARETIAQILNCAPEEIIFTSGATEANNLAIKGVAEAYQHKGRHIVTVATEHRAVLDPCDYLAKVGFAVTYLPVDEQGLVDLDLLAASIQPDTILVSVMVANNEIGVIQPIADIAQICHKRGVLLHCDAAQAIAKIPIDLQQTPISLLSFSAHKVYGPKGIGGLYVRRKNPRVNLAPQLHGGGQERGWRAGTLCTPLIVGMAEALRISWNNHQAENQRLQKLRDQLWHKLSHLEGIYLNGHPTQRLAGNLNISIAGVDGNVLHAGLRPVAAVSWGSACSSHHGGISHVLKAINRSEELARASLRFGIGRFNTAEEIELVGDHLCQLIRELR
jgi:cysteine desulfurase